MRTDYRRKSVTDHPEYSEKFIKSDRKRNLSPLTDIGGKCPRYVPLDTPSNHRTFKQSTNGDDRPSSGGKRLIGVPSLLSMKCPTVSKTQTTADCSDYSENSDSADDDNSDASEDLSDCDVDSGNTPSQPAKALTSKEKNQLERETSAPNKLIEVDNHGNFVHSTAKCLCDRHKKTGLSKREIDEWPLVALRRFVVYNKNQQKRSTKMRPLQLLKDTIKNLRDKLALHKGMENTQKPLYCSVDEIKTRTEETLRRRNLAYTQLEISYAQAAAEQRQFKEIALEQLGKMPVGGNPELIEWSRAMQTVIHSIRG